MRKFLLFGLLVCSPVCVAVAQEQTGSVNSGQVNPHNMKLRPNSRDYSFVRKGNNHQRIVQVRREAMIRQRQATLNRKMAMDHQRKAMQQRMIRQQQIKQRMIRQREMHP